MHEFDFFVVDWLDHPELVDVLLVGHGGHDLDNVVLRLLLSHFIADGEEGVLVGEHVEDVLGQVEVFLLGRLQGSFFRPFADHVNIFDKV